MARDWARQELGRRVALVTLPTYYGPPQGAWGPQWNHGYRPVGPSSAAIASLVLSLVSFMACGLT
ncbi:MAG: hypothetical protein WCI05_08885, partial [Myxococcales bacterium]